MATAHAKHHDYHLVNPSPWPIVGSISAFILAVGAITWMHNMFPAAPFRVRRRRRSACSTPWPAGGATSSARPQSRATTPAWCSSHHRYGMILFIASEVMFFVAWFWAYFNAALFPADPVHATRERAVRRRVAAEGHRDLRSLAPAAAQHADPAHLGHHGDLGAPRACSRTTAEGVKWGLDLHRSSLGALFTCVQAFEYSHAALRLHRQHLRRDLLHGDRLPRRARADRHDLPAGVPVPRLCRATSRRPSISASSSPPGTGTSSTWCGCSCSPASMCGATAASVGAAGGH